ncbi:hypothetical protein RclHR1_03130024 [Rhizophagus clarus]|uniref:Uncharacterized protein n=1 Tax=Rhizophagus clarus TaxID=94130 RepID=A0A2Z6R792_9GLOM|nr:hypothetical protein RclHR1_03130024 [Rhizophagus clarus]
MMTRGERDWEEREFYCNDQKYYADELKRRAQTGEVKHIHSNRLGISYDVIIKSFKGAPYAFRHYTVNYKRWPYFKLYKSLKFDIIRSPQQIQRFKRLSTVILKQNADSAIKKPFMLYEMNDKEKNKPGIVLKQLHHCPRTKQPPHAPVPGTFNFSVTNRTAIKRLRTKVKNARRRYKRKIKLPPLPPNFSGDAIEYYKSRHNLNLNLHYLQDRYWRESLALAKIKHYKEVISHIDTIMKYPEERSVVDITPDHQDNKRDFIISRKDSALLASPDVFLHRIHSPVTPPPDRHTNRRNSHDSVMPVLWVLIRDKRYVWWW